MLLSLLAMHASSAAGFAVLMPAKRTSPAIIRPFELFLVQCPVRARFTPPLTMQDASTSTDAEAIAADADAVFNVIDVDGDGSVSREELTKHLVGAGYTESAVGAIFSKLDSNADGVLSREELRAGFMNYSPLRTAPGLGAYNSEFVTEINADADTLFNSIDTDASGDISEMELRMHLRTFSGYSDAAITNIFSMLDIDEDGDISQEELRNAFVKYSALRQAIGEGPNFK